MSINIQMIRASFEIAKPIGPQVMDKFYELLFQDYPQVKPLFANVKMEVQKQQLLGALSFLVENLDNPIKLDQALVKMGGRHVEYGAEEAHYPAVGQTLLKTFAFFFKDAWTRELEAQWIALYQYAAAKMIEGARIHKDVPVSSNDLHDYITTLAFQMLTKALHSPNMEAKINELVEKRIEQIMRKKLAETTEDFLKKIA